MKITEIIAKLKAPVPPKYISQKRKGGSTIDYIAWFDYCTLLDERVGEGNWTWEIVQMFTGENSKLIEGKTIPDNRLFVTGRLTIIGDDRTLSQMATGTEVLSCSSYGDPSSNAEAMALRRCCAKFGLARILWDKEAKNALSGSDTQNPKNNGYKPIKGEITREEWLRRQAQKQNQN